MSEKNKKPKIIVILGPTASGKSDVAVALAKKFNGEIISADSRQVYKGLNIGTGKITPDTKNFSNFSTGQAKKKYIFTHKGIPHFLINVVSPKKRFSVADFVNLTNKTIVQIATKNKLPIICGGTGFYIDALLGDKQIPEVPPNEKLRKQLEKKSVEELFKMLKKIDPERAETIDKQNPRRLVRAIEICKELGRVPKYQIPNTKFQTLKIGIAPLTPLAPLNLRGEPKKTPFLNEKELKRRINKRIEKWFKMGLLKEVQNLHKKGLSWGRMGEIGLEYKLVTEYLSKGAFDTLQLKKKMSEKTWQYAKRQMTWFKRSQNIIWLPPKISLIEKEVKKFLQRSEVSLR